MSKLIKDLPDVNNRPVRQVVDYRGELESHWMAMQSLAAMIGCTAETFRIWIWQVASDLGRLVKRPDIQGIGRICGRRNIDEVAYAILEWADGLNHRPAIATGRENPASGV